MLFVDHDTLFTRLVNGVLKNRNFVFLLGSGISRPQNGSGPGVPAVGAILDELRRRLKDPEIRTYQEGFERLGTVFDPEEPNRVIREAVLRAYLGKAAVTENSPVSSLEALEEETAAWYMPPALKALTCLIYMFPGSFGRSILTTNFDPLIEIALSAGRRSWHAHYLHDDGSLSRTRGNGASVVHLHGHWLGSDTLHTAYQLSRNRPKLSSSIRRLIGDENTTLVVIGYGGWTDVATNALVAAVTGDEPSFDLIWCFYNANEEEVRSKQPDVVKLMESANARGRGHCVLGVDGNDILPKLVAKLRERKPAQDLRTFLDLETEVRFGDFFHWDHGPWTSFGSLGESINGLSLFGDRVAAASALAAVELELGNLELQPVHQSSNPQRHAWVRPAVASAFERLQASDELSGEELSEYALKAYHAHKDLEENGGASAHRERTLLRAVDYAFASSASAINGSDEFVDGAHFPAKALAGKALHVIWRARQQDDLLLQQIKPRLLGLKNL